MFPGRQLLKIRAPAERTDSAGKPARERRESSKMAAAAWLPPERPEASRPRRTGSPPPWAKFKAQQAGLFDAKAGGVAVTVCTVHGSSGPPGALSPIVTLPWDPGTRARRARGVPSVAAANPGVLNSPAGDAGAPGGREPKMVLAGCHEAEGESDEGTCQKRKKKRRGGKGRKGKKGEKDGTLRLSQGQGRAGRWCPPASKPGQRPSRPLPLRPVL